MYFRGSVSLSVSGTSRVARWVWFGQNLNVLRFELNLKNFCWKNFALGLISDYGYVELILMDYDIISLIINPAFSIEMAYLKYYVRVN